MRFHHSKGAVEIGTSPERQAIATKHRELLAEVDWLSSLAANARLTSAEKLEGMRRATRLKDVLESEHCRMNTLGGRAQLNKAELAFYCRPIHKACLAMTIAGNCLPSPGWHAPLADVRHEFRLVLDDLQQLDT